MAKKFYNILISTGYYCGNGYYKGNNYNGSLRAAQSDSGVNAFELFRF